MRRRPFIYCFALLLLPLIGCQSPPPPVPPPLSFTRYQPIYFDVANIDVVEDYQSPKHEPNVEHLMPTSPAEAVRIWVKDRLRATGSDKTLQVIIKDASVVSTKLPKTGGFFSDEQTRRYDAKLAVEMRIYGNDQPMSLASITVEGARSTTMAESTTPAARAAIYEHMIHDLMEIMNAELEKNIFTYFGNYINYSQTP